MIGRHGGRVWWRVVSGRSAARGEKTWGRGWTYLSHMSSFRRCAHNLASTGWLSNRAAALALVAVCVAGTAVWQATRETAAAAPKRLENAGETAVDFERD